MEISVSNIIKWDYAESCLLVLIGPMKTSLRSIRRLWTLESRGLKAQTLGSLFESLMMQVNVGNP